MGHSPLDPAFQERGPWNEGRLLGAKRALKQQQVWAIRFWLDQHRRLRDRALFDFAIDSKLRGCDVVKVRIGDVVSGGRVRDRAIVVQQKTKRPVQFELMDAARKTMRMWLERRGGSLGDYVFPSRNDYTGHMSTRQYARLVHEWVAGIGLQPQEYGTHSLRRTKASIRGRSGRFASTRKPTFVHCVLTDMVPSRATALHQSRYKQTYPDCRCLSDVRRGIIGGAVPIVCDT